MSKARAVVHMHLPDWRDFFCTAVCKDPSGALSTPGYGTAVLCMCVVVTCLRIVNPYFDKPSSTYDRNISLIMNHEEMYHSKPPCHLFAWGTHDVEPRYTVIC